MVKNLENKKNTQSDILSVKDIIKTVFIAIFVSFLVLSVVRLTVVDGESMMNTYKNGDKLLLNKLAYLIDDPSYKDIIVVKPKDINVPYIIKRVIGTPGDTVEIKDNIIYINGTALKEDYVKEKMETADIKVILGESEYFVCGDNRNNSLDSRSGVLGNVTIDEIYGKIFFNITAVPLLVKLITVVIIFLIIVFGPSFLSFISKNKK